MKFNANDYEIKTVIKILREWTELNQAQFGKSINKSKKTVEKYEQGLINYNFKTIMDIAHKHNIKLTFEKIKEKK